MTSTTLKIVVYEVDPIGIDGDLVHASDVDEADMVVRQRFIEKHPRIPVKHLKTFRTIKVREPKL